MPGPASIQQLIKRCIKNQERAHYELYKLLYSDLKSICCRYEQNQDDVNAFMNAGFYQIVKNLKKYSPEKPFVLWAKRVQVNVILDELRKRKTIKNEMHYHTSETDAIDIEKNVVNEIEEKVELEFIEQAVNQLPEVTKMVFNLHVMDGMSYKEIEDALNLSNNAVKWHMFNARKNLKSHLMQLAKNQTKQAVS
ncbi:MAG: sigma-70 family RNA polymerase sigma factor [Bacteroidetes bacterium]|nr:sigma-70 family RNA polymerase sigma factor [Bacteroidota bacterium]